MRLLLLVVSLAAFTALAVGKGDPLFIKSKGVKLLKQPKPSSVAVSRELAVGTEVKWLGASATDKAFHEIEVEGKRGFVLLSSLSPSRPLPEISEGHGQAMRCEDFAAAAAVKCDFRATPRVFESARAREVEVELLHLEALNGSLRAR